MKLFKKEIIKAINLYLKEVSDTIEINEDEFYNIYLQKYLKKKKKTTAYMMFVKEMHKEYDDKKNIKFSDKAKLIGTKWCNLSDKEKQMYETIAKLDNKNKILKKEEISDHICTWINVQNNKQCSKIIYCKDTKMCKKHFKLYQKKIKYQQRNNPRIKEQVIDNYKNTEVEEFIYESKIMYKDIYDRLYNVNDENQASCIGQISNKKYVFYDL